METQYYKKGFGLKQSVKEPIQLDYNSALIDRIREAGNVLTRGDLTVRLAKEFGFCYGVDRTVQYAYETREKFPHKTIYITNEVIHNPAVNEKLIEMNMCFLNGRYAGAKRYEDLGADDVVLVPAFGVTVDEMELLRQKGCIIVDTTCGSVLNVWKNVERYAREGITSIVHGKYWHEETLATCSQVLRYPGAHYLVLRDLKETDFVCDFIRRGGDRDAFLKKFERATSPAFDPNEHLKSIGLANQTTMMCSESLEIERRLREAMRSRVPGEDQLRARFQAFDTICTATQDRQDAVNEMLKHKLDLLIVVGGFNSSNTSHLAEIGVERGLATYHIEDARCLVGRNAIRHKNVHTNAEEVVEGWMPEGPVIAGVTSGASTPNSKTGEVIEKLFEIKGAALPREQAGNAA
jgi:4-hydroxy-3-methylbut-2-enyl diphosphate reductase